MTYYLVFFILIFVLTFFVTLKVSDYIIKLKQSKDKNTFVSYMEPFKYDSEDYSDDKELEKEQSSPKTKEDSKTPLSSELNNKPNIYIPKDKIEGSSDNIDNTNIENDDEYIDDGDPNDIYDEYDDEFYEDSDIEEYSDDQLDNDQENDYNSAINESIDSNDIQQESAGDTYKRIHKAQLLDAINSNFTYKNIEKLHNIKLDFDKNTLNNILKYKNLKSNSFFTNSKVDDKILKNDYRLFANNKENKRITFPGYITMNTYNRNTQFPMHNNPSQQPQGNQMNQPQSHQPMGGTPYGAQGMQKPMNQPQGHQMNQPQGNQPMGGNPYNNPSQQPMGQPQGNQMNQPQGHQPMGGNPYNNPSQQPMGQPQGNQMNQPQGNQPMGGNYSQFPKRY